MFKMKKYKTNTLNLRFFFKTAFMIKIMHNGFSLVLSKWLPCGHATHCWLLCNHCLVAMLPCQPLFLTTITCPRVVSWMQVKASGRMAVCRVKQQKQNPSTQTVQPNSSSSLISTCLLCTLINHLYKSFTCFSVKLVNTRTGEYKGLSQEHHTFCKTGVSFVSIAFFFIGSFIDNKLKNNLDKYNQLKKCKCQHENSSVKVIKCISILWFLYTFF